MKNIFVFAFCIAIAALSAQSDIKQIESFRGVSFSGNVDIELIPGDKEGYVVTQDHEDLKIDVKDRVLKISLNKVGRVFNNNKAATVTVYYENLSSIKVNAGAQLSHQGVCHFDEMKMRFGSGATGKLEVEGNHLDAGTGEGAVVSLSGKVKSLQAQSSTGAHLKASRLDSDNTDVDADTGGVASVVANKSIEARASLGGTISYQGNPEKFDVKETLGGNISGH